MELNSQRVRALAPENDPLKIGMGWTVEDLDKPQILVESTLRGQPSGKRAPESFVEEAMKGIRDSGGRARVILRRISADGIAQGHDGINYSLAHRDKDCQYD